MYATLEMLKMFDACSAGYGRVLRAVGGIDYGMTKPIPLWIGATTSSGLDDVDWILERGVVIDTDQYAVIHAKAKPILRDHVQYVARLGYSRQLINTREKMEKGRKNTMNTMGLKIMAVMEACANFRSLNDDEVNTLIRFVQPAAFESSNYDRFRQLRKALLAYANLMQPNEVLAELTGACRMQITDEVLFNRPWREILLEKHAEVLKKERELEDTDYRPRKTAKSRMSARQAQAMAEMKAKAQAETETMSEDDRLLAAAQAYEWTMNFSNQFGMDCVPPADKRAVTAFLNLFDQSAFFNQLPLTGERSWSGVTLPNDLNHNNQVDVLTQRDDEGNLKLAVFATNDPIIARQVARFVRAAQLNVQNNILSVGEEDENGNIMLNGAERNSVDLRRPVGDETADDDGDEEVMESDDDEDEDEDDDDERPTVRVATTSATTSSVGIINLSISDLFRTESEITQIHLTPATTTVTTTPVITETHEPTPTGNGKQRATRSRVVS